jgi:2',3'-cyclic-nucleotide 2'-phosphodiesterase
MIRALFFGDVVGRIGRNCFLEQLPRIKRSFNPDLIIVNGENSAKGKGITSKICKAYYNSGVDCITSGNHIYDNREILDKMNDLPYLIRPMNYPSKNPGNTIFRTKINNSEIAIVNFLGQVFMPPTDNPFTIMEYLLEHELNDTPFIFVDFHGEATSEKKAFAYHFKKRVSVIMGSHTHVQTSDAEVIDQHTAYITDVGMIGAKNSILGMKPDPALHRFLTNMPSRLDPPDDDHDMIFNFISVDIDDDGKATKIEAFDRFNF